MLAFDIIAEQRILRAIERGDLDDLPGMGKPLALDDDPLVPPETRMANRILKNAGVVPLEILERREIARLEALLPGLDAGGRARTLARLAVLRTHLFETRTRVRSPGRTLRLVR